MARKPVAPPYTTPGEVSGPSLGQCIPSLIMSLVPAAWIPYPRPPPSVELRSGVLISGCQCVKRDGLQHDCPRTGCQGRAPCMAFPAPVCVPSGNAPTVLQPVTLQKFSGYQSPRGMAMQQPGGERSHRPHSQYTQHPSQDDHYVRLAHRNYEENPPLKRKKVPCSEHRKIRV